MLAFFCIFRVFQLLRLKLGNSHIFVMSKWNGFSQKTLEANKSILWNPLLQDLVACFLEFSVCVVSATCEIGFGNSFYPFIYLFFSQCGGLKFKTAMGTTGSKIINQLKHVSMNLAVMSICTLICVLVKRFYMLQLTLREVSHKTLEVHKVPVFWSRQKCETSLLMCVDFFFIYFQLGRGDLGIEAQPLTDIKERITTEQQSLWY